MRFPKRAYKKTKPEQLVKESLSYPEVLPSDTTENTTLTDDFACCERSVAADSSLILRPSASAGSSDCESSRLTNRNTRFSSSTRFSTGARASVGSFGFSQSMSTRKLKKQQFYNNLLEESFRAHGGLLCEDETEEDRRRSAAREWELHYFWGSPLLLQIYGVLFVSAISRSLWVLHGVYMVMVGHMAMHAFRWFVHITSSSDFLDMCALLRWAATLAVDEVEKAIHGDGFRIWVAGISSLAWGKVGKALVFQLLREQYHAVNEAYLKEHTDKLEQNKKTQMKLLQRSSRLRRDLSNQIKKRSSDLKQFGAEMKERGLELRDTMKEKGQDLRDTMKERTLEIRYNVQDRVKRLTPKSK